jgi:hypothetical protein
MASATTTRGVAALLGSVLLVVAWLCLSETQESLVVREDPPVLGESQQGTSSLAIQEDAVPKAMHVAGGASPVPITQQLASASCGGPHKVPPLEKGAASFKVKHASVLIRHGDRTRAAFDDCWSNDDAKYDCDLSQLNQATGRLQQGQQHVYQTKVLKGRNVLPGTCLLGQLTPKGYRQHYANGYNLRQAYDELLPECAAEAAETLALRSDNQPRTQASGQALVDGLFRDCGAAHKKKHALARLFSAPPNKHTALPWLTMDKHLDSMFPNFHVCPALTRAVRDAKASDEFKQFLSDTHDPLVAKLQQMFAHKKNLMRMYDCMATHVCHHQVIPQELSDPKLMEEMNQALYQHYSIVAKSTRKLAGGPFIGDLLEQLREAVKGTSPVKLALYSGHDTGPIMPVLFAFGVEDGQWAPYASTIVFELLEAPGAHSNEHAVRMLYNGKALHIPGCGGVICPWVSFEAIAAAVVPTELECAEADPELASKCTHWVGMFAELAETSDLFGGSSMS